jgi:hypothetical protein
VTQVGRFPYISEGFRRGGKQQARNVSRNVSRMSAENLPLRELPQVLRFRLAQSKTAPLGARLAWQCQPDQKVELIDWLDR